MAGKTRDEMLADLEAAHEAGDTELARLIASKIGQPQATGTSEPTSPGVFHRALKMAAGIPGGFYGEVMRGEAANAMAVLGGSWDAKKTREKIATDFDQLSTDPKVRKEQLDEEFQNYVAGMGAMVHAPVSLKATFTPLGPRSGGLRGALEKWSAAKALRARKPTEGDTQLLRAQHSTPYGDVAVDAGRVARDMTMPGTNEPVFTVLGSPKTQLARLGQTAEHHGPIVKNIVDAVDQAAPGKAVDLDSLLGQIEGAVADTNTPAERVMNSGRTTSNARQWLQRLRDEVATENRVRATSTDVALGQPPQGRLGLSTTELVPGPEVTLPPQRQIGTEVSFQQGVPLTRTTGPEAAGTPRPTPRKFTADAPYVPPVGEPIQREMFGPRLSAAVEGAPVMTQDPAIAQSVARQGRINPPSFPERAQPVAEATNFVFDPRSTASELWSLVKDLQKRVYAKASERYPGNKNVAEAVKNDPEFAFLMRVADIGKQELERTVSRVKPDALGQFLAAKEGYSNAQSFLPPTKSAANKQASGTGVNEWLSRFGFRHAAFPGIGFMLGGPGGAAAGAATDAVFGLGSRFGNPVAARAGLKMSQMQGPSPESSLNAMHFAGGQFPGSKTQTMEELLAELLRQKKENPSAP